MTSVRSLARRAAVVGVFALTLFAVLEFSIRLAVPEYNPSTHLEFSWHTDGLVLGQPGTTKRQIKNTGDFNVEVRFNRFGLRDSQDITTANDHDFIIVGDSFIFGWGVKEPERISEQLESLIGRRVFNVAVPGDLDTYDRLIAYAMSKAAGRPRVILAVSMETDVAGYRTPAPSRATAAAEPAAENTGLGLRDVKGFLTEHSAVYFLLTQQIHQTPWLRDGAVRLGLIRPNLQRDQGRLAPSEAVAATAARAIDIARRYDATVVLLASRYIWFGDKTEALSDTHNAIAERIRNAGVDMLDLKPVFEADGHPLEYHFKNDGHWQPAGHAAAAAALARHLKDRYGDAL
jgi:hypothetical protein